MANITDYLCSEFDSFDERPLGDVDSLILSWLSYYRLSDEAADARTMRGMTFGELYRMKAFTEATAVAVDEMGARHLLAAVAASPRYDGLRVSNYVEELDEEREKQFSAMTFSFPNGITYVAFRGTDNTLVGWKEDFNLAFEHQLPSQLEAHGYLERVAAQTNGPLYTGGHSKGGNLAIYAAMTCSDETVHRIRAAFSHDGPGFTAEMMASETWSHRTHLIHKTVPNQSVIGMIFDQQDDCTVVSSTETGIMQHNPFSWEIEGCSFKTVDKLDLAAHHVDKSLNDWVAGMSRAEREAFVETLFSIFAAGGEKTFADLGENWATSVPAMLDFAAKLPEETRDSFKSAVGGFFRELAPDISFKGIASSIADSIGMGESAAAQEQTE